MGRTSRIIVPTVSYHSAATKGERSPTAHCRDGKATDHHLASDGLCLNFGKNQSPPSHRFERSHPDPIGRSTGFQRSYRKISNAPIHWHDLISAVDATGQLGELTPAKGSAPKERVLNYACDFRFAGNALEHCCQTGGRTEACTTVAVWARGNDFVITVSISRSRSISRGQSSENLFGLVAEERHQSPKLPAAKGGKREAF